MKNIQPRRRSVGLQKLLPHLQEVPAAFEAVGHIAHVNLPEELQPHRFLIGQARSLSMLLNQHCCLSSPSIAPISSWRCQEHVYLLVDKPGCCSLSLVQDG